MRKTERTEDGADGIEVVEVHNLSADTVAIQKARTWILDNQVIPNQVGLGLIDEARGVFGKSQAQLPGENVDLKYRPRTFPEAARRRERSSSSGKRPARAVSAAPLPNTLYARLRPAETGGYAEFAVHQPARHEEAILAAAIYKFHPDFAGKVNVWWGDPAQDRRSYATLEGGDVMPIQKNGEMLIRIERAHLAAGISASRRRPVQEREEGSRARDRKSEAVAPSSDASGYGLHVRRSRLRAALSGHRQQYRGIFLPSGRQLRRRRTAQDEKRFVEGRRRGAWAEKLRVVEQAGMPASANRSRRIAAPISSAHPGRRVCL